MKVASDGRVPVGRLLGEDATPRSRWRAVLRWRDWSLPLKLGAVTLVPILVALALGGVALTDHLNRADRYDRQDRLAELGAASRTLLDALQRERTLTAAALTDGEGADSAELRAVRGEVDQARPALAEAADRSSAAGARIAAPRERVRERLDGLSGLREEILSGQTGPVEAVTAYTELTRTLLDLHTAVAAGIGAHEFGATADAVHDLLVARDEVGVHQALIGHGIALGLAPSDYNDIRNAEVRRADRVAEFTATATASQRNLFDSTVRGPEFDEYVRVVTAVLAGEDAERDVFGSLTDQQWSATAGTVFGAVGQVADALGGQVTDRAHAEAENATTATVVLAAVLVAALVLTAVVVFAISRQLLRSLRELRGSALDVAQRDLPEAVRRIQDGDVVEGEITPVPVHTRDEVGQVARAFDVVHEEALRLASEQAGMRTGYAGMFVNLSRRSQSLVQRQLQLIERLERDEEDADQLATLFQLDHLATRMRRNNENLMVLSGAEPGRRSGQPVSVTDVLRAAVSEIEQYQRVRVRTSPAMGVVGYAAGDLIRLVAELLDNATAFSAPETTVIVVSSARDDGGLTVEILDEGIGMNEAEVVEANERIGEAGTADMTTSRRMGLFVVGRLATRHGFEVTLHGGKDIVGVRATVIVPAETVTEQTGRSAPTTSAPQHGAETDTRDAESAAANGQPVRSSLTPEGAPLPRRTPARETPAERTDERHAVPEPTDSEMSGTALFTPLDRDEARDTNQAAAPGPHAPGGRTAPGRRSAAVPPPSPTEETTELVPEWPSEADVEFAGPAGAGDFAGPAGAGDFAGPAGAGDSVEPSPGAFGDAPSGSRPEGDLSGSDLFVANSAEVNQWWSAAVSESVGGSPSEAQRRARQAAFDNAETTPIFDEMVSAWFRKVTDAAGNEQPERDWEFAADESFRAVDEVSRRVEPLDYTDAGLPRRRRGERLLPGSAAPAPEGASGADAVEVAAEAEETEIAPEETETAPGETGEASRVSPRNPAEVLGRLSSFQQGVHRGRRHRRAEPEDEVAEPATDNGRARRHEAAADIGSGGGEGETAAGLPRRRPRRSARRPEPEVDETAEIVPGDARMPGPRHAAGRDDAVPTGLGALFVDPVAGTDSDAPAGYVGSDAAVGPTSYDTAADGGAYDTAAGGGAYDTAAGGGAYDTAAGGGSSNTAVDGGGTFAEGGGVMNTAAHGGSRHAAPDGGTAAPAVAGAPDGLFAGGGSPNSPAGGGTMSSAAVGGGGEFDAAGGAGGESDPEAEHTGFASAADERWRTVREITEGNVADYTTAGLPRRRRGERLLPGSATADEPTEIRPRIARDPADVRGRLSSFQQGVRRGRHATSVATDPRDEDMRDEKVEGE